MSKTLTRWYLGTSIHTEVVMVKLGRELELLGSIPSFIENLLCNFGKDAMPIWALVYPPVKWILQSLSNSWGNS